MQMIIIKCDWRTSDWINLLKKLKFTLKKRGHIYILSGNNNEKDFFSQYCRGYGSSPSMLCSVYPQGNSPGSMILILLSLSPSLYSAEAQRPTFTEFSS